MKTLYGEEEKDPFLSEWATPPPNSLLSAPPPAGISPEDALKLLLYPEHDKDSSLISALAEPTAVLGMPTTAPAPQAPALRDPLDFVNSLYADTASVLGALARKVVDLVSVTGTNSNYGTTVALRNNTPGWLRLLVPAGVAVIPSELSRQTQRMVVTRASEYLFMPHQTQTIRLHTYCVDADRDPPATAAYGGAAAQVAIAQLDNASLVAFLQRFEAAIARIAGLIRLDDTGAAFHYTPGTLSSDEIALAACMPWEHADQQVAADLSANLALQTAIWALTDDLTLVQLNEMGRKYEWWIGSAPADMVGCTNAYLRAGGSSRRMK